MPKRVDKNQKEIVEYLRAKGCSVLDLHGVGKGAPDLCVGYRGCNLLLEIKSKKGKQNKLQQKWEQEWGGLMFIVRGMVDIDILLKRVDMGHE